MSRFHLVSWLKASLFPLSRLTSCLWKLALRRKKLLKAVNIGFHLWISVGASTERKSSLFLVQTVWHSFPVQTDLGLSWVKTREISLNLSIGVEFDAPGIFMLPEFPQIWYSFWVCSGFRPKRENPPFLKLFFPFYAFAATWLELARQLKVSF